MKKCDHGPESPWMLLLWTKKTRRQQVCFSDGLCLTWFETAEPGSYCAPDMRCKDAETNGNCDICETVDGRYVEAVNEYASTCDVCGNLAMHEAMTMNKENQLGTCEKCTSKGLKV